MLTALEQHSALLKELAEILFRDVTKTDSNWTEAYFDFRLDTPGCGLGRLIYITPGSRKGIVPSLQLYQIRDCLWDLRDQIPGGEWFGILVQIDRAGNVDVKYDHNPDCIETFMDDEDSHRPF